MSDKKISFFLSHPIQYFSPLLEQLARRISVKAYYFSDISVRGGFDKGFGKEVKWDTPLLEGYESQFLKNYAGDKPMDNHFLDAINPGVIGAVRKENAKLVFINGWVYLSTWLAIITARLTGKKVWLRAESPLNQEMMKSKKVLLIKKWFLGKFLFKLGIDRCLYIGTESKKFFQFYGVPEHKLIFTPYAVNNAYFNNAWKRNKQILPELKRDLGLPSDKRIVLFTGKFIGKKRPLDLLRAFSQVNNDQYCLVMVGDGELKEQIISFIAEKKLGNVFLPGFVNQTKIPDYYSVADVFVMCSGLGETWGLSVNEAMNFDKPVLVSRTCGCSTDLVRHGENGYIFEEGNISELAEYLKGILSNDGLLKSMGQVSGKHVQSFSFEKSVDNICKEMYA